MGTINDLIYEIQSKLKALDSMSSEAMLFHCLITHPSYRPTSKKNSRPIMRSKAGAGRAFLGKSQSLKIQEGILSLCFHNAKIDQGLQTIDQPLHAIYHFHFGPELSSSWAKTDLSNLLEIVSDSLQSAGVIRNDRLIKSFDGTRSYQSDQTRLEVFLLPFTEDLRLHSS